MKEESIETALFDALTRYYTNIANIVVCHIVKNDGAIEKIYKIYDGDTDN